MNVVEALAQSLRRTAYFAETHSIKGVLAAERLAARIPALPERFFEEALELWQLMAAPRVEGPMRRHVTWETPLPDVRVESVVARAVFPLAYEAGALWVERRGLVALIERFRRRAIARLGHLGHSWTIWCSFVEAAPRLTSRDDEILCADRFVELVAAQLAHNDPLQPNPDDAPLDGPAADEEATLDAALARPGFFAHTLITLAWLHRHRARLDDAEWRFAMARVRAMAAEGGGAAGAAIATEAPASGSRAARASDDDVLAAAARCALEGPREVHAITAADASLDLLAVATPRQKSHLARALDALARWDPQRPAAR